ncbi:endolytic transglycosylase MltG [Alloiococcus otitis]|uniref:endolytic transglycosylase MltG n=1 Tax=Alloiococcus otitis TaxID=1652 RepID=UPI0023575333|nr:endolytic transglycosylase MltG [Alloiococcus otitis]
MVKNGSDRTVKKIVTITLSVLVVLLLVFLVSGYFFVNSALGPKDETSDEVIEVEIPQGTSRSNIASILEEEGVIDSAFVYNTYLRMNDEQDFQAGTYEMSPSMSLKEITDYLQEGGQPIGVETATFNVPEGYMLEQFAEIIGNETQYTEEEFMDLVQDEDFIQGQAENYPDLLGETADRDDTRYKLEGYLYPATYEYTEEDSLETIVGRMISQMNAVVEPHLSDIEASDFTVHEILTLASFIEREGITDEDRQVISGVFHNRLDLGMMLQTDVSVTYALGQHQERISYDDLEVDSAYNTYQHTGLGPGPVNSPSANSIDAAVNPVETDYLYFLADLETKEVYFSETYEQHLEYQNQYLKDNGDGSEEGQETEETEAEPEE